MSFPPPQAAPAMEAGRAPAAAALGRWLADASAPRLCAVTGSPGAGKTRLVAELVLADMAGPRRINGAVRLRGMTAEAAAWALADQLALPGRSPEAVIAALAADDRPATVVLAELDESGAGCDGADAAEIVTRLVNPLAASGRARVLVEGRPAFFAPVAVPAHVVHLDAPEHTDRAMFTHWLGEVAARRGLADPARVAAAASMYPNAGLAELALWTGPGDDVPGRWLGMAPAAAWPALESLARAFEPIDGAVWTLWATALAGDAERGRAAVAVVAPIADRVEGAYHLALRPLRERIIAARDAGTSQRIAFALGNASHGAVPKTAGVPDWGRAAPYLRRQMIRHAAAAGIAERMLVDTGCLVHADPFAVTAAIAAAGDRVPEPFAESWRFAGRSLIAATDAATRAACLRRAAVERHDADLAARLLPYAAEAPWHEKWSDLRPPPPQPGAWGGEISALALTSGNGLVVGNPAGEVRVVSAADGSAVGRLPGGSQPVRALAPFQDGSVLYLADQGVLATTAQVMTAAPAPSAEQARKMITANPSAEFTALATDPGAARLVAGDASGTVRLWRLDEPAAPPASAPQHQGAVTAVACLRGSGQARLVVSGGADGTVRLWDPAQQPMDEPAARRGTAVAAVAGAVLPSGPAIVAAWADGHIWYLDIAADRETTIALGFPVAALSLSGDGTLYVAGGHGITALSLNPEHMAAPAQTA
ncbi:WD40 repeat domain-containing protein [Spirillospora sp. NPDC050679]